MEELPRENKLIIGDSADVLKTFPDKSFDLAILDPPYYKIVKAKWDHQWKTLDEYINWLEGICIEVKRVLKDNGSLYVFGDDFYIAYVQVMLDKHFTFLNHCVWYKRNNMCIKGAANARRYACVSERVLFYSAGREGDATGREAMFNEKDCFQSIKQYMRDERRKLMDYRGFKTIEEFNLYIREVTGTASVVDRHYFADSQYVFPTKEIYAKLQTTGFFKRPYETYEFDEYEGLRNEYERLRRPFNYVDKMYEVFDIPIIGGKERTEHPTTKPKELYKRLIECSTNQGALILDPFAGSGTSLISAKETGRYCIAIEKEEKYIPVIEKRINTIIEPRKKPTKKTDVISDPREPDGSQYDYDNTSIEELESMLEDDDREIYEGMLIESCEAFDMVRSAYWKGKGYINVV